MFRDKKILLIDDNYAVKFLTRTLLNDENIDCIINDVSSGEEALQYLAIPENKPDIILLDINMPRMTGYEFLFEYKNNGLYDGDTKIYMLTTTVLEDERQKIMATGIVSECFEKPLTEMHIKRIQEDLLQA